MPADSKTIKPSEQFAPGRLPGVSISSVCRACNACGGGAHICVLRNQVVVRVRPQVLGVELQQGMPGMLTCYVMVK
jgi:hypothetical protein